MAWEAVRHAALRSQRGGISFVAAYPTRPGVSLASDMRFLPFQPSSTMITAASRSISTQRSIVNGLGRGKNVASLGAAQFFQPSLSPNPRGTILRQFFDSKAPRRDDIEQSRGNNRNVVSKESTLEGEKEAISAIEGFQRSEKASKAAQVNLSARLSHKDGRDAKMDWKTFPHELWRLLKLARPELKILGGAIALLLFSSAVTGALPMAIGRIMDMATKGSSDSTFLGLTLYQFFGAFAVVLTFGSMANAGRIYLLRIAGERVVARLRSTLYRKTFVQDAEFFDANRVGDLISRLSSDTLIVAKSITQNVSDGLRSLISGAVGLGAMAWISPDLTIVLACVAPAIGTVALFYTRAIRRISQKLQRNVGTLTKIAEERLGNVKTSQAFTGEIQEVHRYNKQIRKIFQIGRKEALWNASFFPSTAWMGNMSILVMLWFGGGLVRDGLMTYGDLTSFMLYTVFAGSSLFGLSGFVGELAKGTGAATRLFELEDRKIGIHPTTGLRVRSAQGPIKFSNVKFAYPTRPAVTIFHRLNFEIPSGSNVCIVGPSGGGKSTVASLLLRFYELSSGSITINGVDIAKMNAKSLRRRIGMVAQEPVLFSGTIAENIAYGVPDASRSEIVMAAQRANCHFVSDFPAGLDTEVGPRGAQLSGGQKQRVAIARAFLKDPDILILDEATSALDAESETLVNGALRELLKGDRTTISIAHRLATIKRSDRIIVLSSEGTVAETGTFKELNANKDSEFSKLMAWQTSGHEVPESRHVHDPHLYETEVIEEELEEEAENQRDEYENERKPSENAGK